VVMARQTNQRIIKDKFFQLKIYALLLERSIGKPISELRLVFLGGPETWKLRIEPGELEETAQVNPFL
jgi:hypothetical protein